MNRKSQIATSHPVGAPRDDKFSIFASPRQVTKQSQNFYSHLSAINQTELGDQWFF